MDNREATVFWDTNLFIYLLEDSPKFGDAVASLRKSMLRKGARLVTSTMTLGELLVKPVSTGDRSLAERYRTFFRGPYMTVRPFDLDAAEAYSHIRQDRTIQPADAIQLACASSARVDLFITNDDRLSQKNIPGIHFITSLARAPL